MSVFAGIFPASSFALHYASICVCAQTHMHAHTHTHMYADLHTHTHMYADLHTPTHTHTHTHIHTHTWMYIFAHQQHCLWSIPDWTDYCFQSFLFIKGDERVINNESDFYLQDGKSCFILMWYLQRICHYIHCVSLPSWYMLYIICNVAVGEIHIIRRHSHQTHHQTSFTSDTSSDVIHIRHIIRRHSGSLKKTDDAFWVIMSSDL